MLLELAFPLEPDGLDDELEFEGLELLEPLPAFPEPLVEPVLFGLLEPPLGLLLVELVFLEVFELPLGLLVLLVELAVLELLELLLGLLGLLVELAVFELLLELLLELVVFVELPLLEVFACGWLEPAGLLEAVLPL